MGTTSILRCATAFAAPIMGPITPYSAGLMMTDVALTRGANGCSVGGGGHGGGTGSGVASEAEASGHASHAAHSGMESATHRGRSG